jgi:hypothetical protein
MTILRAMIEDGAGMPPGVGEAVKWTLEVGFPIALSWYLLIVTTKVLGELRDELRAFRATIENDRSQHKNDTEALRQDIKTITEHIVRDIQRRRS